MLIYTYESLGSIGHIMVGKPTKLSTIELPRDEPANILACLEQENNQIQRRLDRFHAIQKARKHLKGKVQEQAIEAINEIIALDDERDISDFLDSSNDDFQKFLPTNIRTFLLTHSVQYIMLLLMCNK